MFQKYLCAGIVQFYCYSVNVFMSKLRFTYRNALMLFLIPLLLENVATSPCRLSYSS